MRAAASGSVPPHPHPLQPVHLTQRSLFVPLGVTRQQLAEAPTWPYKLTISVRRIRSMEILK
jgi:hypothetical protein